MMLYILQQNGLLSDTVVCFANTGKESEATLQFVQECSNRWGIPVVWLEYIHDKPKFKIVTFETAARKGEPFEALLSAQNYLPNPVKRICTAELKIKTIRRFVRSMEVKGHFDTYLGLRYDEPDRVAKKKASNATGKVPEFYKMPLHEMRITVKDRDHFWANQPFDLKISSYSDNCDLCFMKGKWNIIWSIRENPGLADWWIEQEAKMKSKSKKRGKGHRFRKEYTYDELKQVALTQTYISFPPTPGQSITCSCTD